MKLIALDFDGVIVPEQAYFYWEDKGGTLINNKRKNPELHRAARCCPICISNLNYVCRQVKGLKIVISSTWRKYFSLEELKEILVEDGFKFTDLIVGVTPSFQKRLSESSYGRRGEEIEAWIKECKEQVEDWVALEQHKRRPPYPN